MNILGVDIDERSRKELYDTAVSYLGGGTFHRIATVNPEYLVLAQRDPDFRRVLQQAEMTIADGFGVVLAGMLHGTKLSRYPGVECLQDLLRYAAAHHVSVFVVVRKDGLSSYDAVQAALHLAYSTLRIDGATCDPEDNRQVSVVSRRAASHAVVLCNFGAPEQEYFLESLRGSPGAVQVAMGVGGAFDFLTGKQKRAPEVMRSMGLEWLWRLFWQPSRWRRIVRAVIVFPTHVFVDRLRK